MGRFWKTDETGYLQNDSSLNLVSEKYRVVLRDAVTAYQQIFGTKLEAIYLTGSVSRGLEDAEKSDIDFFAVLRPGAHIETGMELDLATEKARISILHPWIKKFDFEIWENVWVFPEDCSFSIFAFVIKVHSILLNGVDLAQKIPSFNLQSEIPAVDIGEIANDLAEAIDEVNQNSTSANVQYWSKRIAKNIIRAAFALVMLEHGRFTRDIDLCSQTYLEYVPERSSDLNAVLKEIESPTIDPAKFKSLIAAISKWLIPDAKEWLRKMKI
jgi:uncharacterized protein